MGRRKRKSLKVAAIVVLTGTICALLMPFWLPWALRPALRWQGVQYADYERLGFTRFALHTVDFKRGNTHFTAQRIEAHTPPAWLWKCWVKTKNIDPLLSIKGGELVFDTTRTSTNTDPSFHTVVEKTGKVVFALRRWLPTATAAGSAIQFGTNRITITDLRWQNGTANARAEWIGRVHESAVQLAMNSTTPDGLPVRLTLASTTNGPSADLSVLRRDKLPHVEGSVTWPAGALELSAQFGLAGSWPETVKCSVTADQLSSLGYAAVITDLAIQRHINQFMLELAIQARPKLTNDFLPPAIHTVATVSGNTRSARIERATISIPGLEARLTDPVDISYGGQWFTNAAFRLVANLDELPPLQSTGRLDGHLVLKNDRPDARLPIVEFDATAAAATIAGVAIEQARANGRLDLDGRIVDEATVSAHVRSDSPWFRQTFGGPGQGGLEFGSLAVTAEASGPFKQMKHSGRITVNDLQTAALPPANIMAQWQGEARTFQSFNITATMAEWSFDAAGSLDVRAGRSGFSALLQSAELSRDNEPLLSLTAPAQILGSREMPAERLSVSFQEFNWAGAGGELAFNGETAWPDSGRIEVSARAVKAARWMKTAIAPWTDTWIQHCQLSAAWSNSPVQFRFSTTAQTRANETNNLRGELKLAGGRDGLKIEELAVFDPSGRTLTATGLLPLTIEPTSTNGIVHLHGQSPLSVELATSPGAHFWNRIADWTGVRLHEPEARLSISGTLSNLQGQIQARALSAEIQTAMMSLPRIGDLRAEATFSTTNAALTRFTAMIEEQPAQLSASVPLNAGLWKQPLRSELWPTLKQVSARIEAANASVAAFSRFLPQILSPQGRVDMDISMLPGMNLSGTLSLTNAATRGLLPSGPIRDVQANVRFDGRRAEIQRFSGELGGQIVDVSGHLTWPAEGEPHGALHLRGQRVPLARHPGFILRADVDLSLISSNAATPTLTGTVNLRDSFYLAELRSLMPGRAHTPLQRPPYFSVTNALYADWKLAVKIEGRHGLRVRTPLFRGVMTPNLMLTGTLREPRALGEVRVDEGRVQFPFCSIKIEQGHVSITAANPYRPELFVAGSARAFDYDLQLHATGFVDDLHWEMSSNPPLSPEAIVLLVTAGEVPSNTASFTERKRAGRLMFFLGKSLFSELWLEDSTADKLVIRSGESVTRDGRETYSVEYQFANRWTLVGEYDQFNDVNAGLKWRVYSR